MFVDNLVFLKAIFGEEYTRVHVTSFMHDPSNIPVGQSGICWAGGAYQYKPLMANANQYYTVSLFKNEDYKAKRRKHNFIACYVIGLDDVKEKLPIDQVNRLPPPSIVLKSSLHSEQWLYILRIPETSQDRIDNLHDGLITNGLAPNSKDPGQKGVTRYLRLPEGVNTKQSRIDENGGTPPKCKITEWNPERKYSLEQLADPFGVDLNVPRVPKRNSGATEIEDHPLLQTSAVHVKKTISPGRFDIICPWIDEHTGGDDSGSAIFTNSDGSIGFKCHHGSCEDRSGGDLLTYIESEDAGFSNLFKTWKNMRSFDGIETQSNIVEAESISPWNAIVSMSVNGSSDEMKQKMNDDKFILKDLAILGQWTVFYAGPNTGKTLLTIWLLRESIRSGDIKGGDVMYANCDDTYKGGVEKLKIAEATGFNMLLPNENGFKPDKLIQLMQQTAEAGEALGKVVILDTLKKFTDLMDKRVASKFGEIARSFVSAGGSLICLAHVNKHKDGEGKSIYAGTADIRDDADCVYTIELVGEEVSWEGGSSFTIDFQNTKARGDVSQSLAFQYLKSKGAKYSTLFESVKRLTLEETKEALQKVRDIGQRENDSGAIEAITTAITNGKHTKKDIEAFVADVTNLPRQKVRDTLERYVEHIWNKTKGDRNVYFYRLKEIAKPKINFYGS